jgi:hypothetical protein
MASRPLAERIATAIRDGLRSRQPRRFDNIVDLDARMLRDIGAPTWLISGAVARRDAQHERLRDASVTTLTHVGATRWWARLLMVAGIAILAAPVWIIPAALDGKASVQPPMEGVFTGEFDRGVPVYRLPSVSVSADRNIDPARRSALARNAERARALARGAAGAG